MIFSIFFFSLALQQVLNFRLFEVGHELKWDHLHFYNQITNKPFWHHSRFLSQKLVLNCFIMMSIQTWNIFALLVGGTHSCIISTVYKGNFCFNIFYSSIKFIHNVFTFLLMCGLFYTSFSLVIFQNAFHKWSENCNTACW